MKKVRITAVRQTVYHDLMARYENPIEHSCDVAETMDIRRRPAPRRVVSVGMGEHARIRDVAGQRRRELLRRMDEESDERHDQL